MSRVALILGVTGQDGSLLAEFLLEKNYTVHGFVRRSSTGNLSNLKSILPNIHLHHGDLTDTSSIYKAVRDSHPNEIYNNADQDNIDWSFSTPEYSMDVTARAVVVLLEAVWHLNPAIRVYQPVSATMFGDAPSPQDESSPRNPLSPYSVAKSACYDVCGYYRQCHGLWVSTGILYNHVSLRRTEEYLLRKICNTAVAIAAGRATILTVGSLDMRLDIGYAADYVEASWQILQHTRPDDFIIGTGKAWTIGQVIREAFRQAGVQGSIADHVRLDNQFKRPGPQGELIANPSKIKRILGWQATTPLEDIIKIFINIAQSETKQ